VSHYPSLEVDYVESSARMLELAKARDLGCSQVRWVQEDVYSWLEQCESCYDMVFSHFFLDGLSDREVEEFLLKLNQVSNEGCLWGVSDFDGEVAWWAKAWVWVMYVFFLLSAGVRPRSLGRFDALIGGKGWRLESEQNIMNGFIYSQLWRRETKVTKV